MKSSPVNKITSESDVERQMIHIPRAWILAIFTGWIHPRNFGFQLLFWLSFLISPTVTAIWYIIGLITLKWRIDYFHKQLARKYKLGPMERSMLNIKL